jgi:VWFA-related protein
MNKKVLLAVVVLVCAFVPGVAQTTPDDDVVKITTNLVQVDVVVTRNGKQIRDLKAEDFEIFEDGRRQEIVSFAYVSNVAETSSPNKDPQPDPNSPPVPSAPPATVEGSRRTIVFVVDDYGLSAQSTADVRQQLRKFIDKQMNPNDLIAIVRTSSARRELPQFTNDKSRIEQAWEQVKWNQCSRVGVKTMPRVGANAPAGCGPGIASFAESISSLRVIVAALGHVPGRKSMIIFSDDTPLREDEKLARGSSSVLQGGDSTSDDSGNYNARLRRLAELAIRSSVVIYGVNTGGLQTIGMTAADETRRPMVSGSQGNGLFVQQLRNQSKLIQSRRDGASKIAKATGGFLIQDQNEFLDKVLDDQSGYYLIGYRPSTETFNKRFHKLGARVKQSGYDVRTRSGFFGISEEEAKRLKETKK